MAASAAPSRTSERPLNTESWRSLPGSANFTGLDTGHPSKMSRYEGSHTTTISPTSSISANFLRLYSAMGVPRRGRYCLGMSAFMRLPTPPARRTTLTESFSTVAAATHRTGPRDGASTGGGASAGGGREGPRGAGGEREGGHRFLSQLLDSDDGRGGWRSR